MARDANRIGCNPVLAAVATKAENLLPSQVAEPVTHAMTPSFGVIARSVYPCRMPGQSWLNRQTLSKSEVSRRRTDLGLEAWHAKPREADATDWALLYPDYQRLGGSGWFGRKKGEKFWNACPATEH